MDRSRSLRGACARPGTGPMGPLRQRWKCWSQDWALRLRLLRCSSRTEQAQAQARPVLPVGLAQELQLPGRAQVQERVPGQLPGRAQVQERAPERVPVPVEPPLPGRPALPPAERPRRSTRRRSPQGARQLRRSRLREPGSQSRRRQREREPRSRPCPSTLRRVARHAPRCHRWPSSIE
jgi:hypothetical protein